MEQLWIYRKSSSIPNLKRPQQLWVHNSSKKQLRTINSNNTTVAEIEVKQQQPVKREKTAAVAAAEIA